jgi:hypothetical protein
LTTSLSRVAVEVALRKVAAAVPVDFVLVQAYL